LSGSEARKRTGDYVSMLQIRKSKLSSYLLRQLRGLHLRLNDLESDDVSSRLAAIVSFCAMADGETAFSERRASRIIDTRGLGDDGRWRLSVDGRHCRCRWPSMHESCACLRKPSRRTDAGVEFTRMLRWHGDRRLRSLVRFRSSSTRSELRAARMKMTSAFASHGVNYLL
jgi:hypothetical protein